MSHRIQTVTGVVDWDGDGIWDAHIHLIGGPNQAMSSDADLRLDNEVRVAAELQQFAEAGGSVVVEFSALDYGRDPDALVRLSQHTGVHILMVTGFYHSPGVDDYLKQRTKSQWIEQLTTEAMEGAGVYQARPAFLKWATSEEFTSTEEDIFEIVVEVHHQTGLPIATHTTRGLRALEQVQKLRAAGVEGSDIIIGHLDRELKLDTYLAILNEGAFVTFDQLGKEKYGGNKPRIELIQTLCQMGYSDRIVLGTDLGRKSYLSAFGGGPGLTMLPGTFRRELIDNDFDEDTLQQLLSTNPATAYQRR